MELHLKCLHGMINLFHISYLIKQVRIACGFSFVNTIAMVLMKRYFIVTFAQTIQVLDNLNPICKINLGLLR